MTTDTAVQLITASGGGALLLAVVNAIISRRRSGADATSVLTGAATQLVEDTQAQAHKLAERLEDLENEVSKLQRQARANRRLLEMHARWDEQVVAELHKRGIEIAAPPPLHPDDLPAA